MKDTPDALAQDFISLEKEIYTKWKKEHGDVIQENGMTPHEWYVRNYVDTRLLPAIRINFIPKERVREVVESVEIEKAHTYASENADIYRAHDAGQEQMKERILRALGLDDTGI